MVTLIARFKPTKKNKQVMSKYEIKENDPSWLAEFKDTLLSNQVCAIVDNKENEAMFLKLEEIGLTW